jgi:WD40 repeat protein
VLKIATKAFGLNCIAWSPDGKWLAGGCSDLRLRVWDAKTGEEKIVIEKLRKHVGCVAFSHDSKRIACAGQELTVWDLETRERALKLEGDLASNAAVYSPDGKYLVSDGFHRIVVRDAETGRVLRVLTTNTSGIWNLVFGSDSKRLVAPGVNNTVRVWDVTTGQETLVLRGHTQSLLCVAFSPDGKRIASVAWDQTLKVWDATRDQESLALQGHTSDVRRVVISPSGRYVLSSNPVENQNGSLVGYHHRLWDARAARSIYVPWEPGEAISEPAFSPDGKHIAAGHSRRGSFQCVKLWNLETDRETHTIDRIHGAVAFSRDGKRFAGIPQPSEWRVRVWDLEKGQEVRTFSPPVGFRLYALNPDGTQLAVASPESVNAGPLVVRVWDVASGRELFAQKTSDRYLEALAFTADGRRVMCASRDFTVKGWDVATGKEAFAFKGDGLGLTGASFSPDGRRLVGTAKLSGVTIWELPTGREILTLKAPEGDVYSTAFSVDGNYLVAGVGKVVRVWEAPP